MKQLTCEMCGSTNLIKQDGVFVCQSCGTKYSIEEAKKMMVEGTVDVTGSTIKVDTSTELANLYQIARRARDDNNSENAAKYYDMILIKDPKSWEASFYVVYFKAMQCKIAGIQSAATSVGNCIPTVLRLIKENVGEEGIEDAAREVAVRCVSISTMLYDGAKHHYNELDSQVKTNLAWQKMINDCLAACNILYILGDSLDSILELHSYAVPTWKAAIIDYNALTPYLPTESRAELMMSYVAKVQKFEPSYQAPQTPKKKNGGCYVATAVYGSYDCPQVWTLRRYRDYTLAETWYGRAFIRTYYAISPTLVKWFGHTEWFKKMWKGKLDRMVANLKASGVDDTPYEDKVW